MQAPTLLLIVAVAAATADPVSRLHNVKHRPVLGRPSFDLAVRIVGAHEVDIEDHPYQISLQYNGQHQCGGSIISPNYVLTAAHCVEDNLRFTVCAGSSYHAKGGSVHKVEWMLRHSHYFGDDVGGDIVILRVTEPFVFDSTRQPIELFNTNEEAVPGSIATVTGWGYMYSGAGYSPDKLRGVNVPIVDKKVCYDLYNGIKGAEICASDIKEGGRDFCQTDSGSPLTINGRLAGIVPYGLGCGEKDYPGIYTEVAYFRNWVQDLLRA